MPKIQNQKRQTFCRIVATRSGEVFNIQLSNASHLKPKANWEVRTHCIKCTLENQKRLVENQYTNNYKWNGKNLHTKHTKRCVLRVSSNRRTVGPPVMARLSVYHESLFHTISWMNDNVSRWQRTMLDFFLVDYSMNIKIFFPPIGD